MEYASELVNDALNNLKRSYQKLLMVNLSTDSFEPIIVPDDETYLVQQTSKSISDYFSWFANSDLLHEDDKDNFLNFVTSADVDEHIVYRRRLNDTWRYVLLRLSPTLNYTKLNRECVLYVMDIHNIYAPEYEHLVDKIGSKDNVTGLYNKLAFQRDYQNYEGDDCVGVLYADLNGLKYVNDNYGHREGDELILKFSNLLKLNFDGSRCYHLSGDEFAVMSYGKSIKDFLADSIHFHKSLWSAGEYPMASVGYSVGKVNEINAVVDEAEREMYEDKRMFYAQYPQYQRK